MIDLEHLDSRLSNLWAQFEGFDIAVGDRMTVAGSMRTGYALDILPEEIYGCTDPTATNYNPDATRDDGSCTYPAPTGACCEGSACSTTTEEDCGGIYQGNGTSCSPNPCRAEGACCISDTCSIATASDCGGAYQGDGTTCDPDPCSTRGACCDFMLGFCEVLPSDDCSGTFYGVGTTECPDTNCLAACCDDVTGDCFLDGETNCASYGTYQGVGSTCETAHCERTCPDIGIACDRICNTGRKCGFRDPHDTSLYYKTRRTVRTGVYDQITSGACGGQDEDIHGVIDYNATITENYFGANCETYFQSCLVSGSIVVSADPTPTGECTGYCTASTALNSGCDLPTDTAYAISCDAHACWVFVPGCGRFFLYSSSTPASVEFDDEYTTEELIGNVEAGLPAYDGSFTDSCSASTDLASDEHQYSICRFRYKFTFPAQAFAMYITWAESGPDGVSPLSEVVAAGATESSVHECFEPNANGTTSIVNIECEEA